MVYRVSFFSSFMASIIEFFVMLCIWIMVFRSKSTIAGFDYGQMITYLCISQGITAIYGWNNAIEQTVFKKIKKGDIVFDLLKPVNFNLARVAEGAGGSVIQIIFVCLLLLIIKLFLPMLQGPAGNLQFVMFIVSLILGFCIMSAVSLMAGLTSFFLMNYWGLYYTKKAIIDFFSGSLIPLALLPGWLQQVNKFLPFSSIVYTPVMIYMGQFRTQDMAWAIGKQLMWVVILALFSRFLYRLAIKKVTVNGG